MKHVLVQLAALAALAAPAAFAQSGAAAVTSLSVSPFAEPRTDLARGGRAGVEAVIVGASVSNQLTPRLGSGLDFQYTSSHWQFDNPTAFGGSAPWSGVKRIGLSVPLVYSVDRWRLAAVPGVEWAWATNAKTSEALVWGSTFSATRIFSERLVLGLGAGVFNRIEETRIFPFVVLNWQISDRMRLTNPFRAGPAGPAGLELAYALGGGWEVAGGGAYRSYRFRLDETGPYANGVGEVAGMPLFARLSRQYSPQARLDLYVGASVFNRLKVQDSRGNDIASDRQNAVPLIGGTFAVRF